jgi:uncharacterized protein (DUF608 family)
MRWVCFIEFIIVSTLMAKSLRSKIMRRWRKLKRGHLDNVIMKPKDAKIYENNMASLAGIDFRPKQPKNAYLHPDDPEAEFPKFVPAPIIDLRSTSIPGSGSEWSGASRKNKTITESFVNYEKIGEIEEENLEGEEERKDEGLGKMSEEKGTTSYKVKKSRKSKLRKTIVF